MNTQTMAEQSPRGTAYHEAGHVVVAWSLGLPVGAVTVSADDASGGTQIGLADHLPVVEQLAIYSAGIAAIDLFQQSTHELSAFKDRVGIMRVIKKHGISEKEQGPALREAAYKFARARLEAHRTKVVTLAQLLIEHGRIEAAEVMLLMQKVG
jgi:ATP-dependent Zn protease